MIKKWDPRNLDLKQLSEYLLVGFAVIQFMVYLLLIILEHETSKIIIMGSINILTSFFGLLFVIFTLVKDLKRLHRKTYVVLGVLAFMFRGNMVVYDHIFLSQSKRRLFHNKLNRQRLALVKFYLDGLIYRPVLCKTQTRTRQHSRRGKNDRGV